MSRIFGKSEDEDSPRINSKDVQSFFEERARKSEDVGEISAVIYQDKNPELAIIRDIEEKKLLASIIGPYSGCRILDLGCGNGRWVDPLHAEECYYHGVDASEGLVDLAKCKYEEYERTKFTVCPVQSVSLECIGETSGFDRIMCFGIFIYLNDDELNTMIGNLPKLANERAKLIIREPCGVEERLTIVDHYSDDLEQVYNAIYRTADEIFELAAKYLSKSDFELTASGDVFQEAGLNNRTETRQKWFVFER